MNYVIETKNIKKTFKMGEVLVHALKGIDLKIEKGSFVAIMGASGSGKSTLMNLLGCLDEPSSGDYFLDGIKTSSLSKNEYAAVRNEKIGFVFQGFNLLPRTTAFENVELPLFYDRKHKAQNHKKKVFKVLEKVGLSDRMNHEPNQLSGGQQQRVAIARALINEPSIILADEPTGNLDSRTSIEVFGLFQRLNKQGITIVLVTHERDFANFAERIIQLKDGLVEKDIPVRNRILSEEII